MRNKHNVRILYLETIREDFTQHGLHLNATGKIKVVKLMSQKISQLFETEKTHPIIFKWRTTHNDPILNNGIPIVISEDHVVIYNKERNEDQMDSCNQRTRTSSRPKWLPNTRSDDFFMGIKPDKAVYECSTLMITKQQGCNNVSNFVYNNSTLSSIYDNVNNNQ
jgi:hypothetical protein